MTDTASNLVATGYGKLVGGGVGMILATAVVETADQYLPHDLPSSVTLALAAIFTGLGVYVTPHNAVGRNPANPQ